MKTIDVLLPGTAVSLHGVGAVINAASVSGTALSIRYQVAWVTSGVRYEQWVEEHEILHQHRPNLRMGFQGQP